MHFRFVDCSVPLYEKLQTALHVEDLVDRDALKHLRLRDVTVQGGEGQYFVKISSEQERTLKPLRWKQMTLCIVPVATQMYDENSNFIHVQIHVQIRASTIESLRLTPKTTS